MCGVLNTRATRLIDCTEGLMLKSLNLTIEVAGCPTSCMHCWARGRPYESMPLEDIAWILKQAEHFCTAENLSLDAFPMHEVLAHPEAGQVLSLFHAITASEIDPMATTGVPLAIRDDWRELLEAFSARGTTTVWLAFHGVDDVHDRTVHRAGAYRETCLAVERAHTMGLRCGCNIFLTRENVRQFDPLVADLQRLNIDEMAWEVGQYKPIARWRKYESIRPELDDLLPLVEKIVYLSPFHREQWEHLEMCTEAAYVNKALGNGEDDESHWVYPTMPDAVPLVCRRNLDVYSGMAGLYGSFHGNARADGIDHVLRAGLEEGPCSMDTLHFSIDRIPSVRSLAEQVGDPQGQNIYFKAPDIRQRWLDVALAAYRKY